MKNVSLILFAVTLIACSPKNAAPCGDSRPLSEEWTLARLGAERVFDGLNYDADIFLNGKQIASADTTAGVFIRRAYDLTNL